MATLGLLPPYTLEDVRQAYKKKAQSCHPDFGGSTSQFLKVRKAYDAAQDYLSHRKNRQGWIASQMAKYLAQEELEDQLVELGAIVKSSHTDWLEKSLGDFAELTTSIEEIELPPGKDGAAVIDLMIREKASLESLRRVVLVDCGLTIDRALQLSNFKQLQQVDLSGNRLGGRIRELVDSLSLLKELNIERASVSWWTRRQIRQQLAKRK